MTAFLLLVCIFAGIAIARPIIGAMRAYQATQAHPRSRIAVRHAQQRANVHRPA